MMGDRDLDLRSVDSLAFKDDSQPSLLLFCPTKVRMNDFDVSDVLQDVFSEYLSRGHSISSVASQEKAEIAQQAYDTAKSKSIPNIVLKPLKTDRLAEFFFNQTPSEIKVELNSHLDQLRLFPQKHKKHSVKSKCEHLPSGFDKDQSIQPVGQIICEKEVPRASLDKEFKLLIEPNEIIFDTFSVGSTFKKSCWLRNHYGPLLKGRIVQPLCSEMSINCSGKIVLSTGLSLHIIVTFKPLDLKPKTSSFTVLLSQGTSLNNREFIVPIVTARKTPTLHGFEEIISEEGLEVLKVLKVGKILVGSFKIAQFPLINIGSIATFILTPDSSVNFDDIKDADCTTLEHGPFTISPAKFTLDRKEKVILKVELKTDYSEKFRLELRILCTDDICTDQFQLLGESIYIKRSQFVFKDLEKNFPVSIEDDIIAEYFIDLFKVFPNGSSRTTIILKNISGVPLKFHWEYRLVEAKAEFTHLPSDCIEVLPSQGILRPFCDKKFQISCQMKQAQPSCYRIIIQLIIDNLTEQCLEHVEDIFKIRNETSSNNQVSLIAGEIELWLQVVLPRVIFNPSIVELILSDDKQINFMDVEVCNQSQDEVSVEWIKTCSISIPNFYVQVDPGGVVSVGAGSKTKLRVRVRVFGNVLPYCFFPPSIKQTLVFLINGGETFVELRLHVDLLKEVVVEPSKPDLAESDSNSQVQSATSSKSEQSHVLPAFTDLIHLQPSNEGDLMDIYKGKINEILADENCMKGFIQTNRKDISSKLEHDVKACIVDGLVLGVTEWGDKVEWIIGDIRELEVTLIPPVLDLFLFHQFHERNSITIWNKSLLPTSYRWGESCGRDAKMVKIWLSKSCGELAPNSKIPIDIFMYPLSVGDINDLYVPCHIELMPKPLILKLQGIVEPLRILLQWDVDRGTFQTSWDPNGNESIRRSSTHAESQLEDLKGISSEQLQQPLGGSSFRKVVCNMKEGRLNEFCGNRGRGVMDLPNVSTNTVGEDTPWSCETVPRDSYLMFADCCGPMGCRIDNAVSKVLYDKALHFSLLTGTSGRQVVTLKNLTPIKASFSVKAEVYCLSREAPEYPLFLADESSYHNEYTSLERFSKMRQNDEIPWKVGLFLEIDPKEKELDSYQEVEIAVKANPDVWGEYVDVLVISVPGLPPYSLPLCVDAYGPPIEFTFDPRPKPHLRFGTLCPNGEESYEVTVRNNCYVPLKIAWSTYCKPLLHDSLDEELNELPFSLAVDVHNPLSEQFCQCDLVDYYGSQKDSPFEVFPSVVYIGPYGEAKMRLSVKIPQDCDEGSFEGMCLGLIYEDTNQRIKWRSLCHRSTGLSQLFEMQLSCKIEIPKIEIINIEGTKRHLCFSVAAKDIVKKGEVVELREYYLKNSSKAETTISLEVESPFSLVSVKPKHGEHITYNQSDKTWQLHPHQIITVKILFKAPKILLTEDEDLVLGEIEEMIRSYKSALFFIRQPLISKTQEVILSYEVTYPFLEFSSKRLVFGPVFINETRVKVLRVTAISGNEEFIIERDESCKEEPTPFAFSPTSAVLKQGRYIEIPISFSPSESTGYLDILKVKTSVPNCCFQIVLEGVGTWNYKFHQLSKQLKT